MSVYERAVEMSTAGIDVQVMTIIFRSEGIEDSEIRSAYEQIAQSGNFGIEVERNLPRFAVL